MCVQSCQYCLLLSETSASAVFCNWFRKRTFNIQIRHTNQAWSALCLLPGIFYSSLKLLTLTMLVLSFLYIFFHFVWISITALSYPHLNTALEPDLFAMKLSFLLLRCYCFRFAVQPKSILNLFVILFNYIYLLFFLFHAFLFDYFLLILALSCSELANNYIYSFIIFLILCISFWFFFFVFWLCPDLSWHIIISITK
jgi:hypothetical protein